MVARKTGDAVVQIALRIAPELRDRIKDRAETNGRSVNSELVVTLEKSYPAPAVQKEKLLALASVLFDGAKPDQYQMIKEHIDRGYELMGAPYKIGFEEGRKGARVFLIDSDD